MDKEVVYQRIRAAQAGDMAMQELLVADNLNLVRSVVKRFGLHGEDWDDLFQTGCIGLVKAIRRFDLTRGLQFSSYAVPMIIGEIKQYFRENQKIHISRSVQEMSVKVLKMQEVLYHQLRREPTVGEIADGLGITSIQVAEAMGATRSVGSLDEMSDRGDHKSAMTWLDKVPARAIRPDDSDRLLVADELGRLSERQQTILRMRFWQDKTQAEVARKLGISQVQVSRLEKKALLLLRQEGNRVKSR